ncbi:MULTISPECIES: hybrid sensor histidine kinase/response regulator [Stenotrophomonas]|uniref:hybrid sensor histidine kinase/response regulator n=1 Tax=Stenotrophomonas TaxID=40323 RepID=UPI00201CD1D6|nr:MULTISPECIES: hybrid sensor histidine kinase/response regulator [Stenotrophomonas]MBN5026465.1 hybrid sensor histidine kinase/response regulator [Stenotrophomonas maltophilia]MDH1275072.1 hybrid sensor histidine kinase/response regulator [Stenotrophomonas sp. GD03937]MDH1485287.1 hybrid sensor histidine kinase/response regulator [Stenotrophomonas sp. GD03712]UQY97018.1 hybrid sensor histidine kinase/response regulator [Stenotrophomonas maltophilia]WON70437.1 hybrid sensor histidine kinase/r
MNLLPPDPAQSQTPVNLLIVDDVPQNLVAMQALLQREGVNLLLAGSGAQALELLLEHEVALALLDVHMPEIDGFTLAELMRGSHRSRTIPIIFLTASPDDPVRAFKGYETGAVDFLHKPVAPQVILSKVNVFIELYQQRQLLKARNEALERALKLNETMAAVLTHDLRTPLSAILLCADKLALDLPADNIGARQTLAHLEASTLRMARMVEQLLDFSRIRSGGLRLQASSCDLGDVARAVVAEAGSAHGHSRISLDMHGDTALQGDFDRLGQVAANLIGNALTHGNEARVEVDGRDARNVLLRVSNAGHIDEALLPRLFEPFKASFHPSNGLGLGLYIVDQFVRAHGGRIQASNEAGQVVFEARLPRRCDGPGVTAN